MATLDQKNNKRKSNILLFAFLLIADVVISPYLAEVMDRVLNMIAEGKPMVFPGYLETWGLLSARNNKIWCLIFQLVFILLIVYLYLLYPIRGKVKNVKTIQVTDDIEIPVAVGNGQYGTAQFMTKADLEKTFGCYEIGTKFHGSAGAVVHIELGNKERIYYNTVVPHALIIGATGSGKTRRILLETMYLQILSGSSIICSDVKGELYYYTNRYARREDYQILPLDLRHPNKSIHYNFLQPILDALYVEHNETKAIDAAWDLVSAIVKESNGEPLWYNGEAATIAAAILAVAMEAPENCRNCANVYYFLAYMCQYDEDGNMPINEYIKNLPSAHPAKGVFAAALAAASKTRSSFFTSALATLRLFSSPLVAEMTSKSDFRLQDICEKKSILYMMIPDEKKTMYPLVSLFISQAYMVQIEFANSHGTRLPIEVVYDLDELGNFPYVPVLGSMVSAGRSRGIRVNGIIQDYQQIETNYKDEWRNIKSNAQCKIYLKTDDLQTLKDFSENIGNYTVETPSVSSSVSDGKHSNASYSSSSNMTGRPLLNPAEIAKIQYPYALCKISGMDPLIGNLPDLSRSAINQIYGLGDEEFNRKLMKKEEAARVERRVSMQEIPLWGIWDQYNTKEKSTRGQKSFSQYKSFLD